MSVRRYPNRLVIGRDSASGFVRVGWQSEMLEDRFEIIDVVCETYSSTPITPSSEHFPVYNEACKRIRELNSPLLDQQVQAYLARGWLQVPLGLGTSANAAVADPFGSLLTAATTVLSQLSGNQREVWAVIDNHAVVQVSSRLPNRSMEKLEFEVWQAETLSKLGERPGSIVEGELVALETGLWFRPVGGD
jgi:hypothetical protein